MYRQSPVWLRFAVAASGWFVVAFCALCALLLLAGIVNGALADYTSGKLLRLFVGLLALGVAGLPVSNRDVPLLWRGTYALLAVVLLS